jgi:hypothetical protein
LIYICLVLWLDVQRRKGRESEKEEEEEGGRTE